MAARAIVVLFLTLFRISVVERTIETTNPETLEDQVTALVEGSPVETLVNLVCDCKIRETCGEDGPTPVISRPEDCFDLLRQGNTKSGKYQIYPFGGDGPIYVYCDMKTDNGGWTVFQKREDASLGFYRGWDEYRDGFGHPGGDFWLGNNNLFRITNQNRYTLRVDLEDFEGETRYAEYDHFRISDEETKFKLSLGLYSGTAGDSLTYHADKNFSTKDRDNDLNGDNCASLITSAWWYNDCFRVDLNAAYLGGAHDTRWRGIIWNDWKGNQYSLRRTEMKIRPFGAF